MPTPADQYDPIFQAAGAEWNVDPLVLKALALHESNGNANAVGSSGEQGVMQITPGTQRQLGVTAPFDPTQSIYGGAKYLAMALDAENDNPTAALRYYNGGPGWRSAGASNASYPNAVAAQYVKLAQADTGAQTDATPAPTGTPPTDAPDYTNAPAAATPAKPATAPPATDAYDAALKPSGSGGKAPAEPDAYTKALGATDQTKPPAGAPTQEDINAAMASGGDMPPPIISPPPNVSLQDLKDASSWIERQKVAAVNALQPPDKPPPAPTPGTDTVTPEGFYVPNPNALDFSGGMRRLGQLGVGLVANAAQIPLQIAIGAGGGADARNLTYDPATGTLQLTPEAFAAAQLGAVPLRFGGAGPPASVPTGTFDRAPIPADTAANLLTPEARAAATEPPAGPTTPTGVPGTAGAPVVARPGTEAPTGGAAGPQPAGAQITPSYEAIYTPAEEAAYRARAEGQKLLEPQVIGEPDLNQYIPGETANSAEREQTVKAARELKELGIRVPEASQMDKAAADRNNTARTIYLDNTTKGPVEIQNEMTARQTDINADKAKVFAPDNVTGPVDLQPVIDHMQSVLDEPFNRQNTALQQAYKPWLDRMQAFQDATIKDPQEAWGLRYDMDQQTDKFAQRDNQNMHRVAHKLADAADVLDAQIEKVAPGYDDMLATYKEHSRAIDEMQVLQGAKDKFRGPGQKLTYNDFQRYMKNVVDSRMTPSTDLNPYKAISQDNMQRLWNIRDSLRRTASAQELARAAGSDTMPNIIDSLRAIGKMGGTAALHAYVGAHLGPAGNVALQALGAVGKNLAAQRTIRRGMVQMNRLLNPAEPLRVPPGQENPLSQPPP